MIFLAWDHVSAGLSILFVIRFYCRNALRNGPFKKDPLAFGVCSFETNLLGIHFLTYLKRVNSFSSLTFCKHNTCNCYFVEYNVLKWI